MAAMACLILKLISIQLAYFHIRPETVKREVHLITVKRMPSMHYVSGH